jgi:predicted RNA-binding Zn-ribbon protein involved in translation (DUF1610 family)
MLDFSVIIASLLQLWWLIPIVIIALFFKSSTGKGILGEGMLNFFLNVSLNKEEYKLLKDATLPTHDGTTQIDHIIVSRYGIFVIETKNMKGWIFGSEHQKRWTQSIYGKKHTFQNPIHQNYKHTKTLQKLLDLGDDKVFSVVVFVGESTFKTDMPDNVVRPRGLLQFIKAHDRVVFTPREMENIIDGIEHARFSKSFKTHKEHVENLKANKNKDSTQYKYENLTCPQCGNDLVVRTAKRGQNIGNQFYGCKSYPRCKYTRKLD